MTLAKLSLILGLGFAIPHIYGLMKPKEFAEVVSIELRAGGNTQRRGQAVMIVATAASTPWRLKVMSTADSL